MDLSASSVFASLLVGGVGTGLFIYGKKQGRVPRLLAGVALMIFPMFVPSPTLVYAIGAAVVGALWFGIRAGVC